MSGLARGAERHGCFQGWATTTCQGILLNVIELLICMLYVNVCILQTDHKMDSFIFHPEKLQIFLLNILKTFLAYGYCVTGTFSLRLKEKQLLLFIGAFR